MWKCQLNWQKVTVGQVLNQSTFDNIVRLDEGYRVSRQLRGSPAYWEKAKRDVFAMIRQLGVPTWFFLYQLLKPDGHLFSKFLDNKLNMLNTLMKKLPI